MKDPCERAWEIDPFREGRLGPKDASSFERHLRACPACRRQLDADVRLQQLARRLNDGEPDELALRRVRARVLREAATGSSAVGRSRWVAGIAAASILVAGGLAVRTWTARHPPVHEQAAALTSSSPPPMAPAESYAATIVPSGHARWSQERSLGIERVTLDEGLLHVHVRPQTAAERFLVVLPDGTLEVRGTTFDVHVEHGATTSVHVDEGVVELRVGAPPSTRLAAGESWSPPEQRVPEHAPAPTTAPPQVLATAPTRVSTPASAPAAAPAAPPRAACADAYSAAMRLLRDGHDEQAAAAFHAFAESEPRASQAEDASFLEAVALARAGRGDAAALAAEHHLASFPGSFHRKEASILVARAAAQRGDCAKARATLAPWREDPDSAAALRACP